MNVLGGEGKQAPLVSEEARGIQSRAEQSRQLTEGCVLLLPQMEMDTKSEPSMDNK